MYIIFSNNEEAQSAIVHHYHKSFRGFSAMPTPQEAIELKSKHKYNIERKIQFYIIFIDANAGIVLFF